MADYVRRSEIRREFSCLAEPDIQGTPVELADGAVVAPSIGGAADVSSNDFVEIGALLKAGHAAHPRC